MPLNREQLLSCKDVRRDTATLPSGDVVNVRGLTASEVMECFNTFGTQHGDIPMLVFGVVDDKGERMFSGDDLNTLVDMPNEVISPLLTSIKALSGYGVEAPKARVVSS